MNPVPARAEVAAKVALEKPPPEIGTYRLVIPQDVRDQLDSHIAPTPSRPDDSDRQGDRPTLRPDWADEDEPLPDLGDADGWEWDGPVDADEPESESESELESAAPVEPVGFTVRCPTCHAAFAPPLAEAPQTVLCPECLEDVPVPSRAEAEASTPPARPKPKPRPSAKRTPSADRSAAEEDLKTALPPIPRGDQPARRKKKAKRPPASGRIVDAEPIEEPIERNPTVRRDGAGEVFDRLADIRRAEEDEPPAWTFLSGTLSFPWRSDVILRWAYLTAGCTAVAFLGGLIVLLYGSGDRFGVTAIAFFALPMFWLGLWTLSYAASCGLHVIVETAGGGDRIREWPDPNWREWAGSLIYVFFQLVLTNIVAYFVGQLVGSFLGAPLLWAGLIAFLLFPVVLLSTMETDNPFLPLSGPILRSFWLYPQGWLVFYALTGALTAVLAGAGALAAWQPLVAAVVVGPVEAAYLLIYPRLLGRLAWKASTIEPPERDEPDDAERPRKRKKRKRPRSVHRDDAP
jgi:hypothetical protein